MQRFWSVPVRMDSGTYHDIIPLFAGMENCLPTNHYGPNIRPYYLVHYCISGSGTYYRHDTDEQYPVSAGQIFIIRPEEEITYTANPQDPWVYVWVGFHGTLASKFLTLPAVVDYPMDTFLRIAESVRNFVTTAEFYASAIYEMMYYLFSDAQQTLDVPAQVRHYIEYNYMYELSVEEMAMRFGLSRRYLSKIFKEQYTVSIKEFIVLERMKRAKEFLAAGYSVSEAASMSGYNDVFNFSKMFRKTVGVSPKSYKTQHS